jgi:hypothetical protein
VKSRRPLTTQDTAGILFRDLRELGDRGRGRRQLIHLQQDHRHVVVLRRVADKRRDLAQDALPQLLRGQVRMGLDKPAQPDSPKRSSRAFMRR